MSRSPSRSAICTSVKGNDAKRYVLLKWLLLCTIVTTAGAGGQTFEVASLRRTPEQHGVTSIGPMDSSLFVARNVPLAVLIELAYGFDAVNISRQPPWLSSDLYDLQARLDDQYTSSESGTKAALKQLLISRFKLKTHVEDQQTSGYAIVVANGGVKSAPTQLPASPISVFPNGIYSASMSIHSLAGALALPLHTLVVDESGLDGMYKVELSFAPFDSPDSDAPSIFTALTERLGLKLVPKKMIASRLVIDSLNRSPVAD